jgi:hypothetical protein
VSPSGRRSSSEVGLAESGGVPGWVGAWVGKVVQVYVYGSSDPLLGGQSGEAWVWASCLLLCLRVQSLPSRLR